MKRSVVVLLAALSALALLVVGGPSVAAQAPSTPTGGGRTYPAPSSDQLEMAQRAIDAEQRRLRDAAADPSTSKPAPDLSDSEAVEYLRSELPD